MENVFSQQVAQRQEQQLAPAQLASLALLTAPLAELENRIAVEMERNPLLEAAPPSREELIGDPVGEVSAAETAPDVPAYDGDEEDFSRLSELADGWAAAGATAEASSGDDREAARERHEFELNSLTAPRTLADMLQEQLNFCSLNPRERHAAELVLGSIDEHGYLATHPADIAMAGALTLKEVENALRLVQSFDPPGVGARDAAESLALQLRRRNYPDERIYRLLGEFRADLEHNRLPQIAKAMGVDVARVYAYIGELKKLNPAPASGLDAHVDNAVVLPEMALEFRNGCLEITGRDRYVPHLGLVSKYLKMLEDPDTPPETKSYLREKLTAAESLLKGLALRQSTLERITEVIARRQEGYFKHGLDALAPLTMAEVAQELGVHETTVSRAVAGKYLATPQGVCEYRFFFSGGYRSAEGGDVSNRVVKAAIRAMIEAENARKPLSDAAIAEQLQKQGLNVARRTVAKYRESMNIAPTNLRRQH